MRRKSSKLVYLSAGAALAWFLDPVSGSARRRQLADQLSGLSDKVTAGGDPTGGAAPPVAAYPPSPAPAQPADDLTLLQAVEAAGGGEKVLREDQPEDESDGSRAALRTTW